MNFFSVMGGPVRGGQWPDIGGLVEPKLCLPWRWNHERTCLILMCTSGELDVLFMAAEMMAGLKCLGSMFVMGAQLEWNKPAR